MKILRILLAPFRAYYRACTKVVSYMLELEMDEPERSILLQSMFHSEEIERWK